MAFDRQRQLIPRDAGAVVDHLDPGDAAAGQDHLDPRCAGVQRVFYQLFDRRRRRPLDHLASGNAVDGMGGKPADRRSNHNAV